MIFLFLVQIFFACNGDLPEKTQAVEGVDSGTTDSPETAEDPPELESESLGEGSMYPEEEAPYRNQKRMSVSQIQASMVQVSGGIEWKSQNQEKWAHYSATLGVPDYQQRVREDRSTSVMFQKFLDDAAVHTCTEWVTVETEGEQRLFFAEIEPDEDDSTKTRNNIVYLRHRIQGRSLDPDVAMIDSLINVHHLVMQRSGQLQNAWTTVCVALFTHPDFFMY